jgi:cytochrome c553
MSLLPTTRGCRSLPALVLLAVMADAHAADYLDLREQAPVRGDVAAGAAKSTVCVGCHGPNGNSVVPMFPRLAGQRANYLYWRLVAFRSDDPKSSPMPGMVKTLTDADLRNLAVYFAAQTPAAPAAATAAPASPDGGKGQDLYLHGDSARGIPPCQGCHGADAAGPADRTGQYAAYPALRSQQSAYIVTRLTHFRDGLPQRTTGDFIMHAVAQTLDDASIQALAAWIASRPACTRAVIKNGLVQPPLEELAQMGLNAQVCQHAVKNDLAGPTLAELQGRVVRPRPEDFVGTADHRPSLFRKFMTWVSR